MALIGLTLFFAAGDLGYWQAWVFLAVFGVLVLAITLYLLVKDRALLERRVEVGPLAERQAIQKLLQSIAGLAFVGIFVVAGLDHRHSWSRSRRAAYSEAAGDTARVLVLDVTCGLRRAHAAPAGVPAFTERMTVECAWLRGF